MNKNKYYFLIESPFQCLGIIEAINTLNIEQYKVLVRLNGIANNDKQLLFLVEKFLNKKMVRIVKINKQKLLLDLVKLIFFKIFFQTNDFNYIFIGNYESGFFKLLYKKISNKNKIFLLDDGNKSLSIQKKLIKNKEYYNFFTCFPLKKFEKQKIIQHEFNYIYSQISQYQLKNYILFIGVDIVEQQMITKEVYREHLIKINTLFQNNKILYIPHRNETKEKLLFISDIITIKKINYPIELYSLYEKEVPKYILSYFSTALYSMKLIYKNTKVISLYYSFNNSNLYHLIEDIYKFQSKYMKVLNINDK